jgi:HSP20 family protein
MSSLLDDIDWPTFDSRPTRSYTPVDVEEKEDQYVITADVPGVEKKDIKVSVEDGVLTIKTEKADKNEEDTKGYKHYERSSGNIQRTFKITDSLDADSISASCKNGVLTVSVPKKEKAKAKTIKIN